MYAANETMDELEKLHIDIHKLDEDEYDSLPLHIKKKVDEEIAKKKKLRINK